LANTFLCMDSAKEEQGASAGWPGGNTLADFVTVYR
jgi:hypothetical protein